MPDLLYTLDREEQPVSEDLLRLVRRIEIEEHAEMADMLRLELSTQVEEGEGIWSVIDEDTFDPFTHLRIGLQIGDGPADLMLDTYVIDLNANLSNEPGRSTVEVVAMDATVKMDRKEKQKVWEKMRDSAVAEQLFSDNDLQAGEGSSGAGIKQTEPGEKELEAPLVQRGTDAHLLRRLARRNGYLFYVETDPESEKRVGYFHPIEREDTALDTETQEPLRVSMGHRSNVESFDVRHEMTRPYQAVGSGVNAKDRKKQDAQANKSGSSSLGRNSTLSKTKARRFVSGQLGARSGDLEHYGQARSDRSSYAIEASGRLRTVRYGHILRAKRPVQVEGAGENFSVGYYVEQVQHTITTEEYVQDFTLRSNAKGAKKNQPKKRAP